MAGQAFTKILVSEHYNVVGLSRRGPDIYLDALLEINKIGDYILDFEPELIVNCAAIVSIDDCEKKLDAATKINAKLPEIIAEYSSRTQSRVLHISTDHYYCNDGDKKHKETDPIVITNNYAATKHQGEINAMKNDNTLVLRTNITGFRGDPKRQTFIEWLTTCLIQREELNLFTDFYTSTIDTTSFASLCIRKELEKTTGVLNIASSTSISKKSFAFLMANELGIKLDWSKDCSIQNFGTTRANSLGLDCSKAEGLIGVPMPSPEEVVKVLAKQRPKV